MATLFQTRVYVPGRKKPDLFDYSLILLLCALILCVLLPDEWYSIPFLVASSGLFYFQRYYFDSGKQELYGYFGRYLTINSDSIVINGREYLFSEIENLVVDVSDFDGEEHISAYTVSQKRGVNNFLRFREQSKEYAFPFYLASEQHQKDLRTALDTLLIKGVKVEAFFKDARSAVF